MNRTMKRISLKKILICILAFHIAMFVYIEMFSVRSFSICTLCAQKKKSIKIQLPYSLITLLELQAFEDTKLSILIAKQQIIREHQHNWYFVTGKGNGTRCAIGRGINLDLATKDSIVLLFLKELINASTIDRGKTWLKFILDPELSHNIVEFLNKSYPSDRIKNKEDFQNWYKANIPMHIQIPDSGFDSESSEKP